MSSTNASPSIWSHLWRILQLGRPYRSRLVLAILMGMAASALYLVFPLGLKVLIDTVLTGTDARTLNLLALGLLALFLTQAVVTFFGNYLLDWTGERIIADLRLRLYTHLHRLSLRFFNKERTGDITSRLTNDVGSVRVATTDALVELVSVVLKLGGSAAVMMLLNWRLSVLIFLVIPFAALSTRAFGNRLRTLSRNVQDRLADSTSIAEEVISSIHVVFSFARSPHEIGRYAAAVDRLFHASRQSALLSALFSAVVTLLFLTSISGIFWYGGHEVLAGRLTAGDLVAALFYAMNISQSIGILSGLYATFSRAAGASERIFELLDTEPDVADAPDARPLVGVTGALRFEDVTFAYDPDEPSVLSDVDVMIPAGTRVAVVGPSGAGKTTLLGLVSRLYDPTRGRVCLDGHDVRDVTLQSLREHVAVVSQDVQLFGDTVRENIRYGRLDATDAEVEAAARDANADAFIQALPDGYETRIGERGVRLSGGQRQRVAIARALLTGAPVLLLDEATSALDSESERLVQEALDRLQVGRTSIVVAHRLSTVVGADLILVIDDGRVVQSGTHDTLVQVPGLYQRLAAHQFDVPETPAQEPEDAAPSLPAPASRPLAHAASPLV